MMNNSQNIVKKDAMFVAMMHNLKLIVNFHNEQRLMMENQMSRIESELNSCTDNSERKLLIVKKHTYNNTFDGLLKTNTFLLLYSNLEEFLFHIWKIFGKELEIKDSGSLSRFENILKNILCIDLGKDHEWCLLCDYEKIRNCLLHANGRVSILKNQKKKEDLKRIINESSGHLGIKKDRIELSDEFLESVSITIETLIKRIENIRLEPKESCP